MRTSKWKEKEERKTMQTYKIFFGKEVLQISVRPTAWNLKILSDHKLLYRRYFKDKLCL